MKRSSATWCVQSANFRHDLLSSCAQMGVCLSLSGKIEVEHVISKKLQLKRKAEVCESENDQPVCDLGFLRIITFIRIFLEFCRG